MDGDATKSHSLWAVGEDAPAMRSPVAAEERMLLVNSDRHAVGSRI